IASQVNENFLSAVDLQDRVYVACYNKEKGVYLLQYLNGDWKLEHILNIQGTGNIKLLSLFAINGSLHIIYAKQMTVANFYNIIHLYKPNNPDSHDTNTTWRKNNVCEMYAEKLSNSYSAIMSKEGAIHLTCEWYDGASYLINYCWFDSADDGWKKKVVTTLFKKDITLSILYEDSVLYLLCYTYEDDISAIFCYMRKEGSGKDFEFFCLDKITTPEKVTPYFHIEGTIIYVSWTHNNKFYQYALNREQKTWAKKIAASIPVNEPIQNVEFLRNRKGKYWIVKNTYFTIDYKYNINLPYFKENSSNEPEYKENSENVEIRNADGDLISYIPYLIDEIKTLSQLLKNANERLDQLEAKKLPHSENTSSNNKINAIFETKIDRNDAPKLKKSNFKDQFMKSNKLLSRPEAAAVFVGSANIPNPEELTKKESIEIVENQTPEPQLRQNTSEPVSEAEQTANETNPYKDGNLFKKIGDFFK
ncbi:MAG: hypothetical protein K0R84_2911, partial [Clostridia bacterium]|nr:hypothetical protein [Clostridia bacterium]